ncbi:hypothetical protein PanWU01x14_120730, partial [Parasponia andersonii]
RAKQMGYWLLLHYLLLFKKKKNVYFCDYVFHIINNYILFEKGSAGQPDLSDVIESVYILSGPWSCHCQVHQGSPVRPPTPYKPRRLLHFFPFIHSFVRIAYLAYIILYFFSTSSLSLSL